MRLTNCGNKPAIERLWTRSIARSFREALEEEKLLIVIQVNGKIRRQNHGGGGWDEQRVFRPRHWAIRRLIGFLDGKKVQRVVFYVPRRIS